MTDFITIPLSKTGKKAGKYEVIISIEDSDLAEFNWIAKTFNHTTYARRNKKQKNIHMHRVILERVIGRELNSDEFVDHINRNGLDNRCENLRLATHHQNMMNRSTRGNTPYRGVYFDKNANKFRARIYINRKYKNIGLYDTPEKAYEAYCKVAKEAFGEFANLD